MSGNNCGDDLLTMLFLLDDRRVAVAEVKALNEAQIESMSVLKDEWAVGRYGEAAADGVVYVTTTEGARQFDRLECSFEHGNSFQEGPGPLSDQGYGKRICDPSAQWSPTACVDQRPAGR